MIKSKYIYIKIKHKGIWYAIELTGKKLINHTNEQWEYVNILATNDKSYHRSEHRLDSSIDLDMFNETKYPNVEVRYITYEQAMAYAI